MARNGSGVYSRVNTFTSGSIITAAGHNQNWADLEAEMTNSLALDGQSTMTGQLKAANGTVNAPGYCFGADPNTGFYRIGSNNVGLSLGGIKAIDSSLTALLLNFSGSKYFDFSATGLGIGTTGAAAKLLNIAGVEEATSATQILLEGRFNGYGAGIQFASRTSSAGTLVDMARIVATGSSLWNTTATTQDSRLDFYTTLNGSPAIHWSMDALGGLISGSGTDCPNPHISLTNVLATPDTNTSGAVLYAAVGEMRVKDSAGNTTIISPHNFSDIPGGPSEPLAWAFHSEREIDGEVHSISADMTKALRLLEKVTGETIIHTTTRLA